jgi:hypothetical protein
MSKTNDGGAAFPRPLVHVDMNQPGGTSMAQDGMTLRDYFAAAALQGIYASATDLRRMSESQRSLLHIHAATAAYITADAMLAERERGQQ